MIIAKGTGEGGREVLFLGLSKKNIERMQAGDPVLVAERTNAPKGTLPPGLEILIFTGETELEMLEQCKKRGLVTRETKLDIDPRLKS
jgi:hypothetical protein